jgi:hypothetical protein
VKINYNNTALEFLENPKRVPIHTPGDGGYGKPMTKAEDYKLLYSLIDQFSQEGFSDYFNKNIQYVTQPFYEAYHKAYSKLKEVVLKTPINDSGTLIYQFPHHTQTIFYRIVSNGDGNTDGLDVFMVLFTKHPKSDSYALDALIYLAKEPKELADYVWKGFLDQGRDLAWWVADLMMFNTFLKYAEVQSKIVNAKKKDHHLGVKYVNETSNKVKILDSTYFTTISRTEGFGVKGHFRLQPYGIGMKDRRLQWISDFKKHGYTRVAKISNQ